MRRNKLYKVNSCRVLFFYISELHFHLIAPFQLFCGFSFKLQKAKVRHSNDCNVPLQKFPIQSVKFRAKMSKMHCQLNLQFLYFLIFITNLHFLGGNMRYFSTDNNENFGQLNNFWNCTGLLVFKILGKMMEVLNIPCND